MLVLKFMILTSGGFPGGQDVLSHITCVLYSMLLVFVWRSLKACPSGGAVHSIR